MDHLKMHLLLKKGTHFATHPGTHVAWYLPSPGLGSPSVELMPWPTGCVVVVPHGHWHLRCTWLGPPKPLGKCGRVLCPFFDRVIHEEIWRTSGEELVTQRVFMTYPTGLSSVNRIVNWIGSWRRWEIRKVEDLWWFLFGPLPYKYMVRIHKKK